MSECHRYAAENHGNPGEFHCQVEPVSGSDANSLSSADVSLAVRAATGPHRGTLGHPGPQIRAGGIGNADCNGRALNALTESVSLTSADFSHSIKLKPLSPWRRSSISQDDNEEPMDQDEMK